MAEKEMDVRWHRTPSNVYLSGVSGAHVFCAFGLAGFAALCTESAEFGAQIGVREGTTT